MLAYDGKLLPLSDGHCDVVLFANQLHRAAAAHLAPALLREAVRVTSPSQGFVLLAEMREGRTLEENALNARDDPHGIYRPEAEWRELMQESGLRVLTSADMFSSADTHIYMIARPHRT